MHLDKPIRILQMTASLDFGGSQNMIVNLYKAIDKTKFQFDFILDHPNLLGLAPVVESMGAKIFYMPEFKGTNIKEVKDAWNKFFSEHPEYKILHSHSRSYASIYLPIARKYGVKTIIHSHNTSNGSGLKARIKDLMQYPLRYCADYYIGCSKEAGEWLFGRKIVKGKNFFVLNNAIDAKKFRYNQEVRKKYREMFNVEDKIVYLQVGAFRGQKNYLFTLDVINRLKELKKDIRVYLVGNGPDLNLIEDKIKELNLENYVEILLDRKDVSELLQMADCYIMPSVYEGLSVAAIEAQASGSICLLSNKVNPEVKVSNVVSFLPLDIDTWVNNMNKEVFEKKDTYDDIVKAGFNIEDTAKWLENFYERML